MKSRKPVPRKPCSVLKICRYCAGYTYCRKARKPRDGQILLRKNDGAQ